MRVCRQGVFDNMHWSICLSQSQAAVNQCRHADSSLHARPMSEHVVIKGTKMDEGLKLILKAQSSNIAISAVYTQY